MFDKLKALVRRVDFYLRNEEYYPSTESRVYPVDDDWMGDPNNNPDPLRTRVYWSVRRFWCNHWLCNWDTNFRKVKWAYQRVVRGWDDTAVWSIDYWLDDKMPDMLRQLKKYKHGVPMSMFDGLPLNDEGYHSEPEMEIASKRWDDVIDKMIAGFEANRRMSDGTYEEELGPYPLYRPKGMPKAEWKEYGRQHFEKTQELQKRDEKIYQEGMALFVEHYRSLWD